jgi:hypothetical protein
MRAEYEKPPIAANNRGAISKRNPAGLQSHSTIIKSLLNKLDTELVIIELAAWAAYHGDRLHKADRDRTLLAIRRFEGLRGAIHARLK